MPVELQEEPSGQVLKVHLSGKLTKEDYARFVPVVERMIRQYKKIRMVVEMHDFHGWTLSSLWDDIQFDWKHFGDIERLALVGDRKWEAGMASFCKPFTKATVRYFDIAEIGRAEDWVNEGIAFHAEAP